MAVPAFVFVPATDGKGGLDALLPAGLLAGAGLVLGWLLGRFQGWSGAAAIRAQRQRRLQDRLPEAEAQFQALLDQVGDHALFRLDAQGKVASWNPGAERLFGFRAKEALGRPLADFYPPEAAARDQPARDLARARAQGRFLEEGLRVRKGGADFHAAVHLVPLAGVGGAPVGYLQVTRDLAGRQRAETRIQGLAEFLQHKARAQCEQLLRNVMLMRTLLDHAPVAVGLLDLEGRCLLANPRMESLLGRPQEELLGQVLRKRLPADFLGPPEAAGGAPDHPRERSWRQPDGSSRDYLVQRFPLEDVRGRRWGEGLIMTDDTERIQAERALLQSRKLETLGVFTRGVAHDFNNLLGAMQGNLELARLELPPCEPLEVLQGLVDSAAGLVGQMLTYAGGRPSRLEQLDLDRLVADMLHLLHSAVTKKARLRFQPGLGQARVEADASQIRQLVMNLVLNASEALAETGGEITVRTGAETLDRPLRVEDGPTVTLAPGRYACLEVADDGPGMALEVRQRIFEPFFTTKFTGRGLGLSAVQGIVRGHRGAIQVQSGPGLDTRFRILLPAAGAAAPDPEPPAAPAARRLDRRGSGTVLVVDDEPDMRSVAAKLLNQAGFHVLEAEDGAAALRQLERHGARIRLVLMDLAMPCMDGEEACRELRRRGDPVPVVLTSGFQEPDALARCRDLSLAGFLQKPYKFDALMQLVGRALAGEGPRAGAVPTGASLYKDAWKKPPGS
jgi:PAS domain S-box-containing protein